MDKENVNDEGGEDEELESDDAAYMPYDILEEDEEEGEGMVVVVSRGAGVLVREVANRVNKLREVKPRLIPTRREAPEIGVLLDNLGRLVAEHEQVGYHQLEKNAEFRQLIADLSRHRWKAGIDKPETSSRRRELHRKRRRTDNPPEGS